MTLTVLRDGIEMTIDVTLAARPTSSVTALPQQQALVPHGEEPAPQAQVQNKVRPGILGLDITSEVAQTLGLGVDQGILVIEVQPGGPGAEVTLTIVRQDEIPELPVTLSKQVPN